ncbi:MAG: methyltransferase domain-containing protein [Chloroflexi bacterium]|nr:methyltransferase domain-containing protein [Chloroflexota bacterium]
MTKKDVYLHGHDESVVSHHAMRTAGEAAAFFRPHMRPDMNLLDLGCGPGSITVGLAEWIPEGHVTGIDFDDSVIESAKKDAAERGLTNTDFISGSVYELPFENSSFDAVYSHQVLQHLSEPQQMLREAIRVVKPGGVVGIREVDWGTAGWWPKSESLSRFLEIYNAVADRNGGDANMGRRVRSELNKAGYVDVTVGAGVWAFGNPEEIKGWGEQWARRTLESNIAAKAVEYGIADQSELELVSEGWLAWSRDPDAYYTFTHAEAVGWKPA